MKKQDTRPLNAASVRQLYATMTQYHDTELIEHWDSGAKTQMALLRLFLGHIGVTDMEHALRDYSYTMMDEIYLPFRPGHENEHGFEERPLLFQVATCASVHQRVLHARECDRPNEGHLLYLLSAVNRAYAELAAIRALYEVYHWYLAAHPDEQARWGMGEHNAAFLLRGWLPQHGCTLLATEMSEAEHRLKEILTPTSWQGVQSPAARDVIAFFGWDAVVV
jgi:hypothetical protein